MRKVRLSVVRSEPTYGSRIFDEDTGLEVSGLIPISEGPKLLAARFGQRVGILAYVPNEQQHAYAVGGEFVGERLLATIVPWGTGPVPREPERQTRLFRFAGVNR